MKTMKEIALSLQQEGHNFCCGVDEVGRFDYYEGTFDCEDDDEDQLYYPTVERSGSGIFTATFVDNRDSRKAYEYLVSKYKLLYQSPVKNNDNSGNDLFLCVFDYDTDKFPNL
jgi:hypothetical protein